ncbi:unnamed protein product [Arabidopsis arenosa]|uniref:Uncharacterized protein n=1 Tax=Arabidopsis arenosa TaxID=38785 RepID=A0A8S2B7Q9_ARAAE|nr:unnamed protein product [Arabidopsis arenosa]
MDRIRSIDQTGLLGLCSGSDFVFTSPKPREKTEELKLRLLKLREIAERKEYAELVKDITPKKQVEEPLSSVPKTSSVSSAAGGIIG